MDIRLERIKRSVESERCGVNFLLRVFCACFNLFCTVICRRIFGACLIGIFLNINIRIVGTLYSGSECSLIAADGYKAGCRDSAVTGGCRDCCLSGVNIGKLTVFVNRYRRRIVRCPDNILNRCVVCDNLADIGALCGELDRL